MIKSITSIPLTKEGSRKIAFQIERSVSVPFVRPKVRTVPPTDITTSAPLFLGGDAQIRLELNELQRRKDWKTATAKGDRLSFPIRQLGYWAGWTFFSVKKAFTGTGIINCHLAGNNLAWKMERDGAWALEDGRTIDGLVRIKDV